MGKFICGRILVVFADSGIESAKEAYNEYWKRKKLLKYKSAVDEIIRNNADYSDLKPILED